MQFAPDDSSASASRLRILGDRLGPPRKMCKDTVSHVAATSDVVSVFLVDYDMINFMQILQDIPLFSWAMYLLILLVSGIVYYYGFRPFNWKKDLSDIGYNHLADDLQGRRVSKKDLARSFFRTRKLGNMPPVYPNGWFALLESDDLKPGQVKQVAALGENFAVFRSVDGPVNVLDAYCPHLGANLAVGGIVHGDCIECPFHGWRFRGKDGKCVTIPYTDKVPEFAKVKRWESVETAGFVLVWYHVDDEKPTWRPPPLDQVDSGVWCYRGRLEFTINCHVEDISENGADVSHLNAIHSPSMFSGSDLRFMQRPFWKFIRHVWTVKWTSDPEPNNHLGTIKGTHALRAFDRFNIMSGNFGGKQIGPGYVQFSVESMLGPAIFIHATTPIEPMVQRVVQRMYSPRTVIAPLCNLILFAEGTMIERDIAVWNHKKYEDKPLLVPEDGVIARHRRWYSQFYSANSPRFSFQKQSLEW